MNEATMKFSSFFLPPSRTVAPDVSQRRAQRRRIIACIAAACCFVTLALPAQAQSGVIILVGEISAPTCAWDPKLSFLAPATTAQLTRDCRAVPQQTPSQAASRIAQVRETPVGQEFDKKRVLTVAYW